MHQLVIADLYRDGLRERTVIDDVGAFGWLDDETLITLGQKDYDQPYVIQRILGGHVVDRATFAPPASTGPIASLALTTRHEVYLVLCQDTGDLPRGCLHNAYVRIFPAGDRTLRTDEPPGIDPDRARITPLDVYDREPVPAPPTASPPRDITLVARTEPETLNGISGEMIGAECRDGSEVSFFPDEKTSANMYPEIVEHAAVRWVRTDPPIYELLADLSGPELDGPYRYYFRACDAAPLDAYAPISDDVWASYSEDDYIAGTWTFWRGRDQVGMLRGSGGLLANRVARRR